MNNILALPLTLVKTNYLYLFKITSVILITLLFISYVFQINFEISERYTIRQYETRVAELLMDTRGLEMNFAQKSSLREVTPTLEGMGFQNAEKIYHIQISDQQVVVR